MEYLKNAIILGGPENDINKSLLIYKLLAMSLKLILVNGAISLGYHVSLIVGCLGVYKSRTC